MVIFGHIIDTAALNSFILWKIKYPDWKDSYLDARRTFLLCLGKELVKNHTIRRYKNKDRLQQPIRDHMLTVVPECDRQINPIAQRWSGRCYICTRKNDRKTRNKCEVCAKFVCVEHSKKKVICTQCEK